VFDNREGGTSKYIAASIMGSQIRCAAEGRDLILDWGREVYLLCVF
jgi:hypothetical protein